MNSVIESEKPQRPFWMHDHAEYMARFHKAQFRLPTREERIALIGEEAVLEGERIQKEIEKAARLLAAREAGRRLQLAATSRGSFHD